MLVPTPTSNPWTQRMKPAAKKKFALQGTSDGEGKKLLGGLVMKNVFVLSLTRQQFKTWSNGVLLCTMMYLRVPYKQLIILTFLADTSRNKLQHEADFDGLFKDAVSQYRKW